MFTGLVQALGQLQLVNARQLRVRCPQVDWVATLAVGDSVAVDGACLTVETLVNGGFTVTTSPETLNRTTLGQAVERGWWVNLEPALRVGDRLGGHFVTGHVDGLGTVESLGQSAESWEIRFTVPPAVGRYIVPKGSITVNGISLTVADCNPSGTWFQVAVIPHSFAQTNLQYLQPHRVVNVETDVLGKYVDKLLHPPGLHQGNSVSAPPPVTAAFLAEHGFG